MKKLIINENWEDELIDVSDFIYLVVVEDYTNSMYYIYLDSTDEAVARDGFDVLVENFKELEDSSLNLSLVRLPNTSQVRDLVELASEKSSDRNIIGEILGRIDCEILDSFSTRLHEAKKRKKKQGSLSPFSSLTITTGDPVYNMHMFNKHMGTDFEDQAKEASKEAAKETAPAVDATIEAGEVSGNGSLGSGDASATAPAADAGTGDTGATSGEGSLGEDMKLTEAKRYVKRYYIRPQNTFASNKEEILKALVAAGDRNCSVYSLKNLDDHDDVHLLKPSDIIYYYDDHVLYDKNHVQVMDYDLFVKHEEERKKVADVDTISDSEFNDIYDDRLTDADLKNKEIKVVAPTHEDYNPFKEDFDDINVFGEKLTESKDDKFICCICGEESVGYGNNPEPVKHEGRCCDACNRKFVIPARIEALNLEDEIEENEVDA